jgi:hypothetical protein
MPNAQGQGCSPGELSGELEISGVAEPTLNAGFFPVHDVNGNALNY